ncbi:hypothetical protein BDD12DRAFT_806019 [Trichophaea hybrida]|nr:hypothetical protein BDD12DRAFT_806019 [Trichophaea hybrida]
MTSENYCACEVLKDTLNVCLIYPLERRLFLVIDAMDESDDAGRADIVQFFRNLVFTDTTCVFKIFLASRPINELQQAHPHRIQLKTKEDIEKCTDEYLKDIVIPVQSHLAFGPDLTELNPRQGSSRLMESLGRDDKAKLNHSIVQKAYGVFIRPLQLCELDHALAMPAKLLDHPPKLESWKDWISSDIEKKVTHCGGNFAEIKITDISHFDKGYAIVETIHQTVREFFLGPYKAVASSQFKAVTHEAAARTMIWKTCISYLTLHLAELNESYSDDHEFVQYLNGRPLIKYSVEFFMKEWKDQTRKTTASNSRSRSTSAAAPIPPLLLPYWNALQNCPPSEKFCLLKRLANFSTVDGNDQQYMNRLLGVAAEKGY